MPHGAGDNPPDENWIPVLWSDGHFRRVGTIEAHLAGPVKTDFRNF